MDLSDDELITGYLNGNVESFDTLYDRYASRLLGFILSLGCEFNQAEDIAQKSWLRIIENLERYEKRDRFRAWAFQIAYRQWLDDLRGAWNRKVHSLEEEMKVRSRDDEMRDDDYIPITKELVSDDPSPHECAIAEERSRMIYRALSKLPATLRNTMLLRIQGDLTYREISEIMDCPLSTTLWRARRAEEKLLADLATVTGARLP